MSQLGKLRFGTKYALIEYVEKSASQAVMPHQLMSSHWMVLLQSSMLKPINVKIFQEHVTQVLLPYFKAQVRIVTRTDKIWDEHLEASLTSRAREKRGKGVWRRVETYNTIPRNWQELMRLEGNRLNYLTSWHTRWTTSMEWLILEIYYMCLHTSNALWSLG